MEHGKVRASGACLGIVVARSELCCRKMDEPGDGGAVGGRDLASSSVQPREAGSFPCARSVMVAGVSTGHPAHLWGRLSEELMLFFAACIILSSRKMSGTPCQSRSSVSCGLIPRRISILVQRWFIHSSGIDWVPAMLQKHF